MSSGKTEVITPTPPPAVTAGQSAADYAAALPTILKSQLEFQPQFDRATFESFSELAPQYAQVQRDILEKTSPGLAALDEELAQQALTASQEGLSPELMEDYRNTFVSLVGDPASGIGADYIAKNLLEQDLAYRQAAQNLGLSLQGKVPITQGFQNPSAFQVANSFQPAFQTAQQGQLGRIAASRPFVQRINPMAERIGNIKGIMDIGAQAGGMIAGGVSGFQSGGGFTGALQGLGGG